MPMAESLPCTGSESKVQLAFLCQDKNCQQSVKSYVLTETSPNAIPTQICHCTTMKKTQPICVLNTDL